MFSAFSSWSGRLLSRDRGARPDYEPIGLSTLPAGRIGEEHADEDVESSRAADVSRHDAVAIGGSSLASEAAAATNRAPHGALPALKRYPKAVAWSAFLSLAIIMEGFDTALLTNLFAYPLFKKKFGQLQPDGTYELTAAWQAGLSNAALAGEIAGLFLNGIIAERIGYRYTMIGALSLITVFILIIFTSQNLVQLLIGEILAGIPWGESSSFPRSFRPGKKTEMSRRSRLRAGTDNEKPGVFQTLTTSYASEVCPTHLRAYLTTYVNLCWVLGQLTASAVLRAMVSRGRRVGIQIPFARQWIWPGP